MARALLNVKAIQAAKPAEKEYLISDGDGLFMRPSAHACGRSRH